MINPKENLAGVYLLFNEKMELVYIGQTTYLRNRIWAHVSKNNNGRNPDAVKGDTDYSSKLKLGEACFFSFIEVFSKCERDMVERMLIFYLNPTLNRPSHS